MESVWDYPRPPRLEPCSRNIRVYFAGEQIAESARSLRLLETSHPPAYYVPAQDVRMKFLRASGKRSFCEFKGAASYWDLRVGERVSSAAAWSYAAPADAYRALADHLCFYAGRVDECFVDEMRVQPQPGDFYGGWITADLVGPFKGGPGTLGW